MKLGPFRLKIRPSALIVPALCMGYGLYQYVNVRRLPDSTVNLVLIEPVFILMVIFTIWVLAREIEVGRESAGPKNRADLPSQQATTALLQGSSAKKLGAFVGLSGLYLWLIEPVGFIPCNLAFLMAAMRLLGVKRWSFLVILPVVATAALYLLFEVWMQVPIPAGLLDFYR